MALGFPGVALGFLGLSRRLLGLSWVALGPLLDGSWNLLRGSWAFLGGSWPLRVALGGPSGWLLGFLGRLLAPLGFPLGGFWRLLASRRPYFASSKGISARKQKPRILPVFFQVFRLFGSLSEGLSGLSWPLLGFLLVPLAFFWFPLVPRGSQDEPREAQEVPR